MGADSFYSLDELHSLGLRSFGVNVLISRKASIYSPEHVHIGDHVRIDDFCILSGHVILGNYIHISAFTALYARFGIEMRDFSGLSPRVTVLSASDDFSGSYMTGSMLPDEVRNVTGGRVSIGRFVQIGAGTVVLPSVHCKEGSATGSMSLVTKDLEEWTIYAGIPARPLKARSKRILHLSETLSTDRG